MTIQTGKYNGVSYQLIVTHSGYDQEQESMLYKVNYSFNGPGNTKENPSIINRLMEHNGEAITFDCELDATKAGHCSVINCIHLIYRFDNPSSVSHTLNRTPEFRSYL